MTRAELVRALPQPLRWACQVVVPTGQHRARPHGAAVDTAFRHCPSCGVDTAAVVHADGSHTCAEGHTTTPGGNQ
ncbi:hypothetical protein [Streptomyces sp. NPDC052015]|uniref:hypothetical protein n=1 Tax=Streptomyces sp. NPDC052015 TaxID=3154755 RepID=UPI00344653A3